MSPEQAIHPETHSVVSTVLMLVLGLGVSTLASYVALDLARRVRVLRTRAGALWLLGAASALAIGIWSSQVIGFAAEPPAFAFGYHGFGSLGVWAAALVASLAGLGALSGRVATPGRVGFGAFALGIGAVGTHALALSPLGLAPGHRLADPAAGRGVCGRGRRLHDGARRVLPRRRSHPAGDARLADDVGVRVRHHPGRDPATRARRRGPCRADRLDAQRGRVVGDAGPLRVGRRVRDPQRRAAVLGPRGAPAPVAAPGRDRAAAAQLPRRSDRAAEPAHVRRHARPGGAAGAQHAAAAGGPVHRPRRLQAGQRVARSRDRRPRAARDRGAPEALRATRGSCRPSRRRRIPDADRQRPERRGRGDLLRAPAGLDRRAVPDERARGDRLELDRHRAVPRARADRGADRQRRGCDALGQERRRRRLRVLRGAHDERRARAARAAARSAPCARRRAAASRLPAEDPRAERRDHRRRGADALGAPAARPRRARPVHSDRRALRPDRRDGQLADRGGVPPGRRMARFRPADARRDQPLGAPAAPPGPRRSHRHGAAQATTSSRSCSPARSPSRWRWRTRRTRSAWSSS